MNHTRFQHLFAGLIITLTFFVGLRAYAATPQENLDAAIGEAQDTLAKLSFEGADAPEALRAKLAALLNRVAHCEVNLLRDIKKTLVDFLNDSDAMNPLRALAAETGTTVSAREDFFRAVAKRLFGFDGAIAKDMKEPNSLGLFSSLENTLAQDWYPNESATKVIKDRFDPLWDAALNDAVGNGEPWAAAVRQLALARKLLAQMMNIRVLHAKAYPTKSAPTGPGTTPVPPKTPSMLPPDTARYVFHALLQELNKHPQFTTARRGALERQIDAQVSVATPIERGMPSVEKYCQRFATDAWKDVRGDVAIRMLIALSPGILEKSVEKQKKFSDAVHALSPGEFVNFCRAAVEHLGVTPYANVFLGRVFSQLSSPAGQLANLARIASRGVSEVFSKLVTDSASKAIFAPNAYLPIHSLNDFPHLFAENGKNSPVRATKDGLGGDIFKAEDDRLDQDIAKKNARIQELSKEIPVLNGQIAVLSAEIEKKTADFVANENLYNKVRDTVRTSRQVPFEPTQLQVVTVYLQDEFNKLHGLEDKLSKVRNEIINLEFERDFDSFQSDVKHAIADPDCGLGCEPNQDRNLEKKLRKLIADAIKKIADPAMKKAREELERQEQHVQAASKRAGDNLFALLGVAGQEAVVGFKAQGLRRVERFLEGLNRWVDGGGDLFDVYRTYINSPGSTFAAFLTFPPLGSIAEDMFTESLSERLAEVSKLVEQISNMEKRFRENRNPKEEKSKGMMNYAKDVCLNLSDKNRKINDINSRAKALDLGDVKTVAPEAERSITDYVTGGDCDRAKAADIVKKLKDQIYGYAKAAMVKAINDEARRQDRVPPLQKDVANREDYIAEHLHLLPAGAVEIFVGEAFGSGGKLSEIIKNVAEEIAGSIAGAGSNASEKEVRVARLAVNKIIHEKGYLEFADAIDQLLESLAPDLPKKCSDYKGLKALQNEFTVAKNDIVRQVEKVKETLQKLESLSF